MALYFNLVELKTQFKFLNIREISKYYSFYDRLKSKIKESINYKRKTGCYYFRHCNITLFKEKKVGKNFNMNSTNYFVPKLHDKKDKKDTNDTMVNSGEDWTKKDRFVQYNFNRTIADINIMDERIIWLNNLRNKKNWEVYKK